MSEGNTVKKLDDDGTITVTFADTPVAEAGITQLPFEPVTCTTNVSFTPIGVDCGPTVSGAGLVSINRHGVIGTNDDADDEPAADDVNTPPAPNTTATAAPKPTQRDRTPTEPNMTDPFRPSAPMTERPPTTLKRGALGRRPW